MEIWADICVIYVVLAWVAATLDLGIGLGEENCVRICSTGLKSHRKLYWLRVHTL